MIVMTEDAARDVRAIGPIEDTQGIRSLDPVLIRGGEHAGLYALPERLATDPLFAAWAHILSGLPVIDIDPAEAWPQVDG